MTASALNAAYCTSRIIISTAKAELDHKSCFKPMKGLMKYSMSQSLLPSFTSALNSPFDWPQLSSNFTSCHPPPPP